MLDYQSYNTLPYIRYLLRLDDQARGERLFEEYDHGAFCILALFFFSPSSGPGSNHGNPPPSFLEYFQGVIKHSLGA